MKRSIPLLFTMIICCAIADSHAQIIIQAGAMVHIPGPVDICLQDIDMVNNDPGSDVRGLNIIVKGNANSYLSGSGGWRFGTLNISKPGSAVLLGTDIILEKGLTLTGGQLDLNQHQLTLASGAMITGENEVNRVTGPAGGYIETTTNLNMPSVLNPGRLGVYLTTAANLGETTIRRWHKPDPADATKVHRFYEIIPTVNQSLNAAIRLDYFESELNGLDETLLQVFFRNVSTENWIGEPGSVVNVEQNFLSITGLSSLPKLYSIAGSISLPIEWGKVNGVCKNGDIIIGWNSITEQDVSYYRIERSSDGSTWAGIGTTPALGTDNGAREYEFKDDASLPAAAYYRIVSVDLDGSTSISPVITVTGCAVLLNVRLAPVPADHETTLYIDIPLRQASRFAQIRILAADARLVRSHQVTLTPGTNTFRLSLENVSPGVYFVNVILPGGETKTLKLIKR